VQHRSSPSDLLARKATGSGQREANSFWEGEMTSFRVIRAVDWARAKETGEQSSTWVLGKAGTRPSVRVDRSDCSSRKRKASDDDSRTWGTRRWIRAVLFASGLRTRKRRRRRHSGHSVERPALASGKPVNHGFTSGQGPASSGPA
jgi:hypothetical protein